MKKSLNQSTMVIILNSLSIAFVIATIISFLNVASLHQKVDQSNRDRFELTYNANRFMNGSAYLTNEVRAFAVTGNMVHFDNYWNEINVAKNRDIGVARLKEIGITDEEQARIDRMSALSNNLVPLESDAMDKTIAGLREEAIEDVYGDAYYEWIGQILSTKDEFLSMLDERALSAVDDLNAQIGQAKTITFAFIAIISVLQVISALLIMSRLIVPIKKLEKGMGEIAIGKLHQNINLASDTSEIGRLTDAIHKTQDELKEYIGDISDKLKRISQGDLNIKVTTDYIGDFAPIKTALTVIIDSFNDVLSQITASTARVSISSKQLADGAQTLAGGASEQAATLQQLSASVSDISDKTKENAERTENAAKLANTIMNNAEKGSRQMEQMINAVNEINNANQSISKVIKAIDDIAFQTNILALNAAVEAARAGAAGKGFAVVAEEVRNLAAKSAESAKDTGSLIANSMEKAQLGTKIAGETAASLSEIVEGISESNRIITEIARSSDEQFSAISQINTAIGEVTNVVQQNSATAEESAAVSEEMSGQASVLEGLVSNFKLKV
ncbi:MAG: methyl-accepting chemotaxis protein [Oscillospiraceae bacterium]|nr:methyl-accepting chemotaxis protein [Oscillospiraceae bacterium]